MSTELFCLLSLITLRIKPNLSEEIALNSEALRQKKNQFKTKKAKKTTSLASWSHVLFYDDQISQ